MKNLIAQDWGTVPPPPGITTDLSGLQQVITIFLRTLIVIAAIYAVLNIILAGYTYISAGGDPKKIQDATAKIWQSVLGLVVAAGAFALAAIIGQILFGDSNALLQLKYFTL
ncbi:hypothetical protein A2165_01200 [Candidatus Curtissbacteria bacterium RBG_13_40_7]|uniref:Uncharacterized protein n=1 Tax=Candidatus Curtissbacteria bacterium RBG_13_40_7 TaxID=1797706 RepID=A0A1F5FW17_9BACT|nr:MAG: hypothetical protein A2165_01200 [Candidatus Curtissbacteria bacterium RBG_13_40_7]